MVTTHNLGFPRIGVGRELKFALEGYWQGRIDGPELERQAALLRRTHWRAQDGLDWLPVGDFSLYDHVLDMSITLGNVPQRALKQQLGGLDRYFALARGQSSEGCGCVQAAEMTKWFDSNYHYIVPELNEHTAFSLHADRLVAQFEEARAQGVKAKPVLLGPVSYLWLAKASSEKDRLEWLSVLLPVYAQLLVRLAEAGAEWIQVDEPILVTDLEPKWQQALRLAYHSLKSPRYKILLTTYFGKLEDNIQLACELPVQGLHIDAVNAQEEVARLVDWLPVHKIVSLGVINGRNIWKTNLTVLLDWLEPLHQKLGDRLWLAPSSSLLHVPVDVNQEKNLDADIKSWLSFAVQKLNELQILARALNEGRSSVLEDLQRNQDCIDSRASSTRVHRPAVKQALAELSIAAGNRTSGYGERIKKQAEHLALPSYPTTTIGSFPQTSTIRQLRKHFRQGQITEAQYIVSLKNEIRLCIEQQENLGLDVLVHGEAERNDMVEYFGEQLDGYAFTEFGWVQSYGSRCVKPPILYGDICRTQAMTVTWAQYAQSLTAKPVKGMLTGPVTLLNWSFVRDDQDRSTTCYQLALAVREEVLDLERAGIRIIQIDEAALREGLPLRRSLWKQYLHWAIEAFRFSANGVQDQTQIHTHMCYSEFNEFVEAIATMDADVITIETSRSNAELLTAFERFDYPNSIGPGVYDIHSPNIPSQESIEALMVSAARKIRPERLWVNPDCGLKTRQWNEVLPALQNMVAAARVLRGDHVGTATEAP